MKSPVSLSLYQYNISTQHSGLYRTVTPQLQKTWRRTIRDIGGYWIGTAQWDGSSAEMIDMFQTGMMMEIREAAGGMVTWQGFLAEMSLTYKGQTYTRSWADVANKVKVIYSLMGVNLLDNPSCETTVWDAYGTPSTRERSTTWATQGDYSAHIVTDAANEGVIIDSAIGITAGIYYQGRVTVNIVSGIWRLEIYRSDGTVVDYSDQQEAGQVVMMVGISDDNLVGGSVALRLYCTDATGECYADAAVFQIIAQRAETGWKTNTNSQDEYGVIEYIESQIGMTNGAANALASEILAEKAWARIKPPGQATTIENGDSNDRLDLTFYGYAATLRNFYTEYGGTEDDASDIVTNIIGEAEFVDASLIKTNTLSYYVEDIQQYRAWDLLREITKAGDASGNRWICGVYANRKFFYEQADETLPVARIRNGKILSSSGGPLEGWLAEPGLMALDDMPIAYDIGERVSDRLNMAWMNEVEWSLGAYLDGQPGIVYRKVTV